MFNRFKIKKLVAQICAEEGELSSELIAQIAKYGKDAFPGVAMAFQNNKLDPMKAKILLEELYDDSLIDNLLALTGNSREVVRDITKNLVRKKLNQSVIKKIIDNLEDPNTYLRTSSTELLCEVKSESATADLTSLYNKVNTELKLNIINILTETGGDIAFKHLIKTLKSKEWRLRARAVRGLGKLKKPKSVDPLIEILSEKDPQMIKSALDALVEIGDKRAAVPILELLKDQDFLIRQKAMDAIQQLADTSIIKEVLALMGDSNINTKRCATEILNSMKDPKTGEALVKAMKDSDWWVRNIAIDALAGIKGENTIKILIAMLNDSDENIRRSAVEFFNKVSDPSAVEPLIGLLKDKDWWVREKAVTALGRLKDPSAIQHLTALSDDEEIKHVIPNALAKIGGTDVVKHITEFLEDDQKQVRIEAIKALVSLKVPEVVSELKRVLDDPEEDVKSEARQALKKITGKVFTGRKGKSDEQPSKTKGLGAKDVEGSLMSEAIVVVDLCNSTAIANKYGDQFALELTKILSETAKIIYTREKAQFMKSTGDGFLLTFAKIINAIRFGLDLRKEIAEYNKKADKSRLIELRFAINCGETRVDAKKDRLGVATNMTFRVEGVNKEGLIEVEGGIKKDEMPGVNRILITENVVDEVKNTDGLDAKLLGLFELKGISGLHRIFEVIENN